MLRDMLLHYEKVIKTFEESNVIKMKHEADMVVPNYSFSPQLDKKALGEVTQIKVLHQTLEAMYSIHT